MVLGNHNMYLQTRRVDNSICPSISSYLIIILWLLQVDLMR